jgi:serum/glucocorticoid-regulated kinase 2
MGNVATCQQLCSRKNPKGDEGSITVCKSDFKFHHPIGRGAFGKVFLVEHSSKMYAMKEMLKARVMAKKSIESIMMEL